MKPIILLIVTTQRHAVSLVPKKLEVGGMF